MVGLNTWRLYRESQKDNEHLPLHARLMYLTITREQAPLLARSVFEWGQSRWRLAATVGFVDPLSIARFNC